MGRHKAVTPEPIADPHCLPWQQVIPQPPQLLSSSGLTHTPLQQIPAKGMLLPTGARKQRLPSRRDAQP
jgi:hypothetical protein